MYRRYAETARNYFQNTGKRVKAWCFVQGARANRIFYAFEVRGASPFHNIGLRVGVWCTASPLNPCYCTPAEFRIVCYHNPGLSM
jgi:hypothetical protein